MSIRHTLLAALDNAGYLSLDDLQEKTGEERKIVLDNLNAAKADHLVERSADEVSGRAVYHITPVGKKRLESGPRKGTGKTLADLVAKHASAATPEPNQADVFAKKSARYLTIDFNRGLLGDGDYTELGEARAAAELHAREHGISVDVCQVVGTARFEQIPSVTWSSE